MTTRPGELTRERIVDEAIALLDEQGTAALSMRRLAARLGTSTMSTYHHLADKDALIEAVAERLTAQLPTPAEGTPWDDVVRTMAWAFRDLTIAHPAAFRLFVGVASPPALLAAVDRIAAVLASQGFDPSDAAMAVSAFARYLIGSTLTDADPFGTARRPLHQRADREADEFRFGLEALIAGVAAHPG